MCLWVSSAESRTLLQETSWLDLLFSVFTAHNLPRRCILHAVSETLRTSKSASANIQRLYCTYPSVISVWDGGQWRDSVNSDRVDPVRNGYLGKVKRKGVRKHRMVVPPIVIPGWRTEKRRSALPVGTVKSNVVFFTLFMALGINQVIYSDRKFCQSVCPGFASLGTSR